MLVNAAIRQLTESIKEGDANYEALTTLLGMYEKLEGMIEELEEERKGLEKTAEKSLDFCDQYKQAIIKLQLENDELKATNKVLEEKLLNSNKFMKDVKDTMVQSKAGKNTNDLFQTAFNAAMGALRDMDKKN